MADLCDAIKVSEIVTGSVALTCPVPSRTC